MKEFQYEQQYKILPRNWDAKATTPLMWNILVAQKNVIFYPSTYNFLRERIFPTLIKNIFINV